MKMRGNSELAVLRNIYYLAAVFILISSFAGCAAGSCLSYGHACWGAHGKRSGVVRPAERLSTSDNNNNNNKQQRVAAPPFDERWLLSRLVNRQLMQVPLAAKLRERMFAARAEQQQQQQQPLALLRMTQPLTADEELPGQLVKHNMAIEKHSENTDLRDMTKAEQRMVEGESSDILLYPQRKDFSNEDDQAIKMGLYKILENIDEKLK